MALLVDNWANQLVSLAAAGWVITEYSRYDPTTVVGVTPSGKAFSVSAVRNGAGARVTVTVAGNTRTANLANWETDFEQGDKAKAAILAAYQLLPAGQR